MHNSQFNYLGCQGRHGQHNLMLPSYPSMCMRCAHDSDGNWNDQHTFFGMWSVDLLYILFNVACQM